MIHLDTSFLIRAIAGDRAFADPLRGWLREGEELGISVVAWAGFLCGPLDAADQTLATRFVTLREPLTADHDAFAARLYNETGRRRGSLADCMIAATAIRSGALLATANRGDFEPFREAGLRLAR